MTASHSSTVMLTSIRSRRIPALQTRTSSPPKVSTAWPDQVAGAVEVGDVVGVGDRLAAHREDLVDDLLGRSGRGALAADAAAQVVDHDLRTLAGEREGLGPTDAAPGARHDGHASVTDPHVSLLVGPARRPAAARVDREPYFWRARGLLAEAAEGAGVVRPVGGPVPLQRERVGEAQPVAAVVEAQHLARPPGWARCRGRGRPPGRAARRVATTWLTRPMRSASSASTKLPVIDISRALRSPTARGSSAVSPHPGTTSSRAWVSANRARSDATTKVQLSAISSPPETHAPFTAQIVGVIEARERRSGVGPQRPVDRTALAPDLLLEVDAGGEDGVGRRDHERVHVR